MARKATAQAAEPEVEEGGIRSRMYLHEALAGYIEATYDVELNSLTAPEIIAWAFAKRNEWRATDAYGDLKEAHAEEAAAAKAERAAARAAKPKAEKAAKATKTTKKAAAKKAPAKKAAPRKAAKKSAGGGSESPFE